MYPELMAILPQTTEHPSILVDTKGVVVAVNDPFRSRSGAGGAGSRRIRVGKPLNRAHWGLISPILAAGRELNHEICVTGGMFGHGDRSRVTTWLIRDQEYRVQGIWGVFRPVDRACTRWPADVHIVRALNEAVGIRDPYTKGHAERVALYARIIGYCMDFEETVKDELLLAGLAHDVGKVAVPQRILLKPGPLSDEEWTMVCRHPEWGARILAPLRAFEPIIHAVLSHHERVDGNGYPRGLKDGEIPLIARVLAVADTFEALTSERSYRPARPLVSAVEELVRVAGKQLDEGIVSTFAELLYCTGLVTFSELWS